MILKDHIEYWANKIDEDIQYSSSKEKIKPFIVYVTDDKGFLKPYRNEIFNLIQDAYKDKGGFLGADNPRTLMKDTDRAKIVFDDNGDIIACALYRLDRGGVKRFGSAGLRGNKASIKAVSDIIKTDIEPYDGWYWVEASGIIEKLFNKYNGNPIPNIIAQSLLELDGKNEGFRIDETDNVHYFRTINGEEKRKMIFGFKDEETKNMAEAAVGDYGSFKLSVNSSNGEMLESEDDVSENMERCRKFLSRLYDFHYEDGCNEILPEWNEDMMNAMLYIRKNLKLMPENKIQMYKAALRRGITCKDSMTVISFNKIVV